MKSQNKYTIFKVEDIKAALSAEELGQLHRLLQKVHATRVAQNRPTNRYFVLNLTDPFARAALDAYVQAAETDPQVKGNPCVQEILLLLRDMLFGSRLECDERLPD